MPGTPAVTDVSVVIPTWNRRERLGRLLESLAAQTLDPERFEIVVVDDGSEDGTSEAVRMFAAEHPKLHVVVVTQPNQGVNGARNAGILASHGAAISFLDDDELAPETHLELVCWELDQRRDIPGVGGPARGVSGERPRTCRTCALGETIVADASDGRAKRLLGGNMTIRREIFDEVGLFDAEISGRGDETEWFSRADREFVYLDELFIWHRRDDMSLRELCRTGYRQGKAVPLLYERTGEQWRPSVVKLVRYLAHAGRLRCSFGLIQASRELGSLESWLGRAIRRRLQSVRS